MKTRDLYWSNTFYALLWQKRQYWILLPPLFQQIHFKVLRYSWTCVAFQDGVEIGWLDLMRPHFEKIWGLEIHKLEFCAKMLQEPQNESSSNSHVWSLRPFPTEELIIVFVNMFIAPLALWFNAAKPFGIQNLLTRHSITFFGA